MKKEPRTIAPQFTFSVLAVLLFTAFNASAYTLEMPLSKLSPLPKIHLRCITADYGVAVPIPARWKVEKATLKFNYVNSSNLLGDISQLVVKINEDAVGQTKLDPKNPEGSLAVNFPAALFETGYNTLSFQATQHFTRSCETPCAPDLWTTVNLDEAILTIEYSLRPVPMQLSQAPGFIFDPRILPQGEVNIITEGYTSDNLTLAGIVASGVAKRFDYRKTLFSTSEGIRGGHDNVLLGKKEYVEDFLAKRGVTGLKINGPFVKVIPLPVDGPQADLTGGQTEPAQADAPRDVSKQVKELLAAKGVTLETAIKEIGAPPAYFNDIINGMRIGKQWRPQIAKYLGMAEESLWGGQSHRKDRFDPTHAMVIVSGLNNDHLKIAAETLASLTFPYPGTDEMTVLEFQLPEITLYGGKQMLAADKIIRLKSLDFHTHSFRGMQPNPLQLSFRLPPDFFIRENQYVKFILNFTYGAGLRPDSVMNVLLNGVHVRSINLDKSTGDFIEDYKVEIPTYLFKPGNNALRIVPILTPNAKECDLIQPESLFLTIFENSSIYFPPMSHFVEMPNLELFTLNGFPFTRWPDGFESLIYITKPEAGIVDAALNMMGMITQKNGYPLIGMKMTLVEPKNWDGEIMVFGPVGTIPPAIAKNSPLSIAEESQISYPILKNFGESEVYAKTKQISGLGANNGVLMEYQSSLKSGRTITLFTGLTGKEIYDLSLAILDPGAQGLIAGDMSLVQLTPPDYKVDTQRVGERYYTGKYGRFSLKDYLLSSIQLYYATIAGVFAAMVTGAYLFIRRQRKNRLQSTEDTSVKLSLWMNMKAMFMKLFIKKSPPDDKDN
ncbi:MAG: cellulose biosynthesis cyclic di-GMP-binding regulatory protein BcsB [Nitrospinae bacterium]|nr:cellulose biosynthesis cyclic di-GMP-binding regulatory protein BcsB [Nitrospinota bacterium]